MSLFNLLEEKAKKKKRNIGISIFRWTDSIEESLIKAKDVANVIVYGDPREFEGVKETNEEQIGRKMAHQII